MEAPPGFGKGSTGGQGTRKASRGAIRGELSGAPFRDMRRSGHRDRRTGGWRAPAERRSSTGLSLSRVLLIKPRRFGDERGWFMETYSRRALAALGIEAEFVQDNHSLSIPVGTLRGLHFQIPPHAQGKLVRCTAGRVMDVAVDIRRGSPTWGRWVCVELSARNGEQLWVPPGFAHGFVTLVPDAEIAYKVTDYYDPVCDRGIRWDSVGIDWPLPERGPVLSPKDKTLPPLSEFDSPFAYDGEPLAAEIG